MSDARERALQKLLEPIPGREPVRRAETRPLEAATEPPAAVPAAEPAKREDAARAAEPGPVEQTVLDAVAAADWLEAADAAAVAVARRIARDLDQLPAGETSVATLSRSLTGVLTSLQLTPAGRRQQQAASASSDPAAPVDPLAKLRARGAAARLAEQAAAS